MTLCDYCNGTIPKKNKQFCNQDCMINFMRMQECHHCLARFEPKWSTQSYCSQNCEDKSNIWNFKSNLQTLLGLGIFGKFPSYELTEICFKATCNETGKIMDEKIVF